MEPQSLPYYLDKYTAGELTNEEWKVLRRLLDDPANQQLLLEYSDRQLEEADREGVSYPDVTEVVLGQVLKAIREERSTAAPLPVRRVVTMRKWGWAAAVLLVLGMGSFFFYRISGRQVVVEKHVTEDIPPGTDRAMLTLADGRKIVLDTAADGRLAEQGGTGVVKLADGQIVYDHKEAGRVDGMMNTLATPNGGQYRLVLPDGSRVWLNAASSIHFPTSFGDDQRLVSITGEAYFEVAGRSSAPFKVNVGGDAVVEVLGTSFNINSYQDEGSIRTTLVEGKVRVQGGVLKPGQQAAILRSDGRVTIIDHADVGQAVAWKNGIFDFSGDDLAGMLRQMERWYDIEVKYEGVLPKIEFGGKMDRGVKLSGVMRLLSDHGVRTRLEGRALIVEGNK